MSSEEKETDRQSFFFCEKEMQAWGLKGDNHRAQQPAAKGFGKLQEAGVLGCKTSIALQGLGTIPDSCAPHRHKGLVIKRDRMGDSRLESGL